MSIAAMRMAAGVRRDAKSRAAHANTRVRLAVLRRLRAARAALARAWPAAASGDPEAIRRVRIASRRLREALRISQVAAPCRRATDLVESLRGLRRALGSVRDDAVALDRVGAYRERGDTGPAVRELEALISGRQRRAEKALSHITNPGSLRRLTGAVDVVIGSVERSRVEAPFARALWSALLSRLADARRAADAAGPVYEPEQLHALRLAIKKLRYVCELAAQASLVPATLAGRLRRQQKHLGLWHDYVAVVDLMRAEEARRDPQNPKAWATLFAEVDRQARVRFGQVRRGRHRLDRCLDDVRAVVAGAVLNSRTRPARAALHDGGYRRTGVRRS